jgi:hypothetical protein
MIPGVGNRIPYTSIPVRILFGDNSFERLQLDVDCSVLCRNISSWNGNRPFTRESILGNNEQGYAKALV